MAIYHLSAKLVQRSNGESAVAGAAYRAGEKLHDARRDKTEDYQRKRGVVVTKILAPENAPEWVYDREQLWNRAERAEKRWDAQPAREIRVALPHELDDEGRADLVFSFARDAFVKNGMVADIGIHLPDRHGDERNHHAHILLTMRELDGDQFSRKKQREWNKSELLEDWREQWAEYQNRALEEAGSDARVDHRTLEAQGIDCEPTRHLGKDTNARERKGEKTELGDRNREIEKRNREATERKRYMDDLVNELAAVEAELAEVLAKEFFGTETEPHAEPEILIVTASGVTIEPYPSPALSWEEQKREAQSAFNSAQTKEDERQLREHGEIREFGLGKHWFDRTVAFWQDVYSDTATFVKDTWQKYVTDRKDRDTSPDREGDNDRVDRSKSFWQKYVTGRDEGKKDPDHGDFEPER